MKRRYDLSRLAVRRERFDAAVREAAAAAEESISQFCIRLGVSAAKVNMAEKRLGVKLRRSRPSGGAGRDVSWLKGRRNPLAK